MADSAKTMTNIGDWVGLVLECRDSPDQYQILRFLAAGGMANVFMARRQSDGAQVVVKIPKPHLLQTDETFAKRFHREIQILNTFNHPHIVPVYGVGDVNGLPFVVMPLLLGGSLRDRSQPGVPVSQNLMHQWLRPIASALDDIHARNLYHRDVKPDNILFDQENRAYLTDFGIVKPTTGNMTNITNAGGVIGTALYMSPEAIEGKPIDHRSDQFALAATVYELLAGQVPFPGETAAAVFYAQMSKKLKPVHLFDPRWSMALSAVILQGLSRRPTDRFQTCLEFATEVLRKLPAPTRDQQILVAPADSVQPKPKTTSVIAQGDTKSSGQQPGVLPAPAVEQKPSGSNAAPIRAARLIPAKPASGSAPEIHVQASAIPVATPLAPIEAKPQAPSVPQLDIPERDIPVAEQLRRPVNKDSGLIFADAEPEAPDRITAEWYLKIRSKVRGPYEAEQVLEFLRSGQVQPHTEASTDRRKWKALEFIDQFTGTLTATTSRRRRSRNPIRLKPFLIGLVLLLVIGSAGYGLYSLLGSINSKSKNSSAPTINRGRP